MRASAQKKMCWNCEGNVQLQDEVCPYCQTILDNFDQLTLNTNLAHGTALYPPAYDQSKIIPATTFALPSTEQADQDKQLLPRPHESSLLTMTIAMALLMTGLLFSIFALVLLVFAHNGKLILAWNSTYWYIYALLAMPLLFFGWRAIQNVEEEG